MRPADTWVCVADDGRAQFYRCDGPGRSLVPMLDYSFSTRARVGPRPNTAAGCCAPWQAVSVSPEGEVARFISRIAVQLNRAAEAQLFEHLVLVAPPGTLGALHDSLNAAARSKVVREFDKDLTHATPREVATHVGESLPH